jgi:hypothetical protein
VNKDKMKKIQQIIQEWVVWSGWMYVATWFLSMF